MNLALIRTLLYFDIFSYPLTSDELFDYTGIPAHQRGHAQQFLDQLVQHGMIAYAKGFYYFGNIHSVVSRRMQGNRRAKKRMRSAKIFSRIISSFPYVRCVMLSGSISKSYMGNNDDIDYFIITHPGRLWIARTLLTLFKKLFLFNSHRNFCINYFVDARHLAVREQNRFTATEIAFLLPMYNKNMYQKVMRTNEWIKEYYPFFRQSHAYVTDKVPLIKRWMEHLLGNGFGGKLEDWLFRLSQRFIRKKFREMDQQSFDQCFSIRKHELRYLPNRQQSRILKRFCWKMTVFERRYKDRFNLLLNKDLHPVSEHHTEEQYAALQKY